MRLEHAGELLKCDQRGALKSQLQQPCDLNPHLSHLQNGYTGAHSVGGYPSHPAEGLPKR